MKKKTFNCPSCKGTRLQQVHYGHVEDGKFVDDEITQYACVYCHAVYSAGEIGIVRPEEGKEIKDG